MTWTSCITEIKSEEDLLGPGAAPGTVPTDLEQSTGLERLEILGKMDGVDIFDMRPLDASRKGAEAIYLEEYPQKAMIGLTIYNRNHRQPHHGQVCW